MTIDACNWCRLSQNNNKFFYKTTTINHQLMLFKYSTLKLTNFEKTVSGLNSETLHKTSSTLTKKYQQDFPAYYQNNMVAKITTLNMNIVNGYS